MKISVEKLGTDKKAKKSDVAALLPCPFCGNESVGEVLRNHFDKDTVAVECGSCRTRGPEYPTGCGKLHIKWWNTRNQTEDRC